MDLILSFEEPGEHVQAAAQELFRLYPVDGRYVLPDVVLKPAPGVRKVELQHASVQSAASASREHDEIADRVRRAWNNAAAGSDVWQRGGRSFIYGRRELAMRTVIDAPATPLETELEISVAWRYTATDLLAVSVTGTAPVRLLLMPAHAEPPPPGTDPGVRDAFPSSRPDLPFPLRKVPENGKVYNEFAVVDFGTSSSTVAVLDTREVVHRPLDPAQAEHLRGALADLCEEKPPQPLSGQWDRLLEDLLATLRERLGATVGGAAELAGMLRAADEQPVREPAPVDLLDLVCLRLLELLASCGSALADWLAPRLHGCFDRAFSVPNLDELRIREVVFDENGDNPREQVSSFRITGGSPVAIAFGDGGQDLWRDLKSRLFESQRLPGMYEENGREASTDVLIAHVYKLLIERTERFVSDPDQPAQHVVDLVATYPTTTPPFARHRLADLLGHCLDLSEVVIAFDEGVAAGLYFLMRDFGSGRMEFGAEALRARSVQISADPPTWRQRMLLIDIGAGTTDIALLGLTLLDVTDQAEPGRTGRTGRTGEAGAERADPLSRGRKYLLRPEVLHSTGHAQLGGNYLTLRVFYWLKAALLDALLTGSCGQPADRDALAERIELVLASGQAGLRPLAPWVAASGSASRGGSDAPVPPLLRKALNAGLPTIWHALPDPEPVQKIFHDLWALAEQTKIKMSSRTDATVSVDHTRLQDLLRRVDQSGTRNLPPLLDLLPPGDLVLPREQFETLLRPVLRDAVELARWLVRSTPAGPEGARLDRVVLSGKTSRMPLLEEVVVEVLAHGGDPLPWNPSELAVESERAKQAASLGAAWAQHIRQRGAGGGEEVLARGSTIVTIDVDNLFHSVPCEFQLMLTASNVKQLIAPGTRMIEIDGAGTLAARSPWEPLMPGFQVQRPTGAERSIQWGVFRLARYRDSSGHLPDPAVFHPSVDGVRTGRVLAQLQVDTLLTPTLNLSNGHAHFHVPPVPDRTLELREHLDPPPTGNGRLSALPGELLAVPEDAEDGEPVLLFPAWDPAQGDLITDYLPRVFHASNDLESKAIPGRISAPLPTPGSSGDYRFLLRRPDGTRTTLGTLHAPGERGFGRYLVTLDAYGRLILHRGEIPYWKAKNLRDVERFPGSVLNVPMERGESELKPERDPFNGRH